MAVQQLLMKKPFAPLKLHSRPKQFQILTKNSKNPIKLQLPIVMATYPIRNKDGTLKRRKGAAYPDSLPVFRPWMETMKK